MIGDLPEIHNLFDDENSLSDEEMKSKLISQDKLNEKDILIYISTDKSKWVLCNFIDFAPSRIGIHLYIPAAFNFEASDLDHIQLKFEKVNDNRCLLLKEMTVLLRWQERDPATGRVKIGLHFHGDVRNDTLLNEILDKIKELKSNQA
jgi:hypothetical protein